MGPRAGGVPSLGKETDGERSEKRRGKGAGKAGAAPARSVGRGRSNGGYGGRGRGKRWVVKSKCAAEIGAIEPTTTAMEEREREGEVVRLSPWRD